MQANWTATSSPRTKGLAPKCSFTAFITTTSTMCFPRNYYEYITPLKRGEGHCARSGENSDFVTDKAWRQ